MLGSENGYPLRPENQIPNNYGGIVPVAETGLRTLFYNPVSQQTASLVPPRIFQVLVACGMMIFVLGLFYPVINSAMLPDPTKILAPAPPNITFTSQEREKYDVDIEAYQKEVTSTTRRKEVYEAWTPVRYLLDFIVLLTFLFGIIIPRSPTRLGMLLTMIGLLSLLCLTAFTLLPTHIGIFAVFAGLECLLLFPAAKLFVGEYV